MTEADDAVTNSLQFEAKKDACKQLQSGEWTLTLKLHPDQVSQALMLAAPGQRYMCVLAAIGDNDESIAPANTPTTNGPTETPKTPWHERSPGSQAAYLCTLPEFQMWAMSVVYGPASLGEKHYCTANTAKIALYKHFGVKSRSDLDPLAWAEFMDLYRTDTREGAEMRG
jgi:hypothetical protein